MNSKIIKSLEVTSDDQLRSLAHQLNIDLDGIYDFRNINAPLPQTGSYLILLRDTPGVGHWIAIHNNTYFDSMGAAPPSILDIDTFGDKQYQGTYDEYCGLWCLLFLYASQHNRPDLLDGFTNLDVDVYTSP